MALDNYQQAALTELRTAHRIYNHPLKISVPTTKLLRRREAPAIFPHRFDLDTLAP